MTYFIVFYDKDEFEWAVFQTRDKEYANKVFDDLFPLPGYNMELRCTAEPIETFMTYDVLRSDHSQF